MATWTDPNASWRTSTVIDLCKSMRHTRDYANLPILADALQDAGFDDDNVLEDLRTKPYDRIDGDRITALFASVETATAVMWMDVRVGDLRHADWADDDYTEEEVNYRWLISAIDLYVREEENTDEDNGMGWQAVWYRHVEDFWKNYTLITGTPAPEPYPVPGWATSPEQARSIRNHHVFTCTC